jgi:hypothetical protein
MHSACAVEFKLFSAGLRCITLYTLPRKYSDDVYEQNYRDMIVNH